MSFALHPKFALTGVNAKPYVYVFYTAITGARHHIRLSRFDLLQPQDDRLGSEVILIDQQRNNSGFHHGGTVLSDDAGFLYLSIGDLSDTMMLQQIDRVLASGIMRLDVDQRGGNVSRPIRKQPVNGRTGHYYIPMDNPFHDTPEALEEFWALGFRNPFRMSMDRKTGRLWVGDVGADTYEEITLVHRGSNAQWP